MTLNVLGTDYTVTVKKYTEDKYFAKNDAAGYCSGSEKEIVLCEMTTYKGWEDETKESCDAQQRLMLRHEIVHAYLNESGLSCNTNDVSAWARNEEMVDWFAIQGPKIFKTWKEAGAL